MSWVWLAGVVLFGAIVRLGIRLRVVFRGEQGTGRTYRNAKVVPRVGRARSLPALSDSYTSPDPEFGRKVEAIRALAEHYGSTPGAQPDAAPPGPAHSTAVPTVPGVPLVVESAWSARLGGGKQGTFVATAEHCSRDCHWIGDFTSADGTDSRTGVGMAERGDLQQVGDRGPALDTGADSEGSCGAGACWCLL